MTNALPSLYYSATLAPRIPITMPFLLDYLPETPVTIAVLSSLGKNRYLLDLNGRPFEAEIPAELATGTRLAARLRESSSGRIVLDIPLRAPTPAESPTAAPADNAPARSEPPTAWTFERNIDDLLERMATPRTETTRKTAAALLRWEAPVNRETIQTIVATVEKTTTPTEPSIETAAFLLSRGIPPTPETTELFTKALLPREEATASPTPKEIASIKASVADAPRAIRAMADNTIAAVRAALASSPALEIVDALMTDIDRLLSRPTEKRTELPESTAEIREKILQTIRRIATTLTERPEATDIRPLLERLPPADLREVRTALAEVERELIASHPPLATLKGAKPADLIGHERQMVYHAVNQLSAARGETMLLTEIPVTLQGTTRFIPLRVLVDDGGNRGGGGGGTTLTIDVDMSHIGKVTTQATVRPTQAAVRFTVRDGSVKSLFDENLAELREGLARVGLAAAVDVGVRKSKAPADESPLMALVRQGERYTSVDIRA